MYSLMLCCVPVELVLFCQPSPVQSSIYRGLLSSRVLRSVLSSCDPATHLMCIGALKKLCNHPMLLHSKAVENDEVSCGITVMKIYYHTHMGRWQLFKCGIKWTCFKYV